MRRLSGGTALALGMVAFGLSMVALVAWLIFGGVAGKERGLSFQNQTSQVLVLKFGDGRVTTFQPHAQQTLPMKPGQFPQTFTVTDASGRALYEQTFAFPDLKHYAFQMGLELNGFLLYRGITSPGTY